MTNHNTALYQTAQIHELERLAMSVGNLSAEKLMEQAGAVALKQLRLHWRDVKNIAIFCGKGNNGGDGFVLARLARRNGLKVVVYQMATVDQLSGAALTAAKACERSGVEMKPFQVENAFVADVIVDALIGTGLNQEVSAQYRAAINKINDAGLPILALDVPSGLSVDTGAVFGIAIKATHTITFMGLKPGLFTGLGPAHCGTVSCDTLNVPAKIFAQVHPVAQLLDFNDLSSHLLRRNRSTHKGNYGHVLIVGGDYGMAGAARMAGEAAARVGAGLVSVATHPEHVAVVSAVRPELMCHAIEKESDLKPLLKRANVVVIGPGLGQSHWSQKLWQMVLETGHPKVLDADALNLLANQPMQRDNWILTPHPGEAARLSAISTEQIQADRLAAVMQLQKKYKGVCVLKGAGTLVRGSDDMTYVCNAGNPGMASGGMGDVLSGVIGGLLAQGFSLEEAARLGVYVHSLAADRAALEGGERGLLALDLMPYLQRLVNPH